MQAARTLQVTTIAVPSIPLPDAREHFLTGLHWKTSSLSGRRLTASTAEKYRSWLKRFDRWLVSNELPSDIGYLSENDFRHLQADILDEIETGTLTESSASTYVRCIKTFFSDTWDRLELDERSNPTRRLRAGTQQAVDFPLFKPEHVRALLRAAIRPRSANIASWVPYRDQALLATFFDLGWRVGEASGALISHVDLRTGCLQIPRENAKGQHRGRVVGINADTGRLLRSWIERWRPAVRNEYLFVSETGDRFLPNAIRKMFRRLAEAEDISSTAARVSPHTCRHYFAVQWARQHPGDLAGLQRVLGHSSVRTTQIYFERADDLGAVERHQEMASNWR